MSIHTPMHMPCAPPFLPLACLEQGLALFTAHAPLAYCAMPLPTPVSRNTHGFLLDTPHITPGLWLTNLTNPNSAFLTVR